MSRCGSQHFTPPGRLPRSQPESVVLISDVRVGHQRAMFLKTESVATDLSTGCGDPVIILPDIDDLQYLRQRPDGAIFLHHADPQIVILRRRESPHKSTHFPDIRDTGNDLTTDHIAIK